MHTQAYAQTPLFLVSQVVGGPGYLQLSWLKTQGLEQRS